MPVLNWVGKDSIINHDKDIPFRLLKKKKSKSIENSVNFEELATYIFFTETRTILDKKSINKNYIGTHNDIEYYLIFKEIGKNVLNKEFLSKLNGNQIKVVHADKCIISKELLDQHKTIFKQIPYEVRIF